MAFPNSNFEKNVIIFQEHMLLLRYGGGHDLGARLDGNATDGSVETLSSELGWRRGSHHSASPVPLRPGVTQGSGTTERRRFGRSAVPFVGTRRLPEISVGKSVCPAALAEQ